MWAKNLQLERPNELSFIGLTSVLVSDLTDAKNTMVLGNQQYIVNREKCIEFVVMVHHPLYWFRNQEEVENYLKRARVVLVGHEHQPKIYVMEHEAGRTLWIYAGSTNPPENTELYTYRYNWIEFKQCTQNGELTLEVKVQPRVWNPKETKFDLDHNLLKGKEFLVYNLHCPEFQVPIQEPVAIASADPKPVNVQEVVEEARESMNKDNNGFIRLRYLFWKHLDWSERLTVLVN